MFPFSKANRACFIPVTETSILDRSTEWSSFWVLDWDLPCAVPLLPAVILNDISYRPLKGYISTYGFNITPFISKRWKTGFHDCRVFLKVTKNMCMVQCFTKILIVVDVVDLAESSWNLYIIWLIVYTLVYIVYMLTILFIRFF